MMKKALFTLFLTALTAFSALAQTQPERILIHKSTGDLVSFLAERVDSITFPTVEGEVAADVTISEVSVEVVKLAIQRTEECDYFKIKIFPELQVNRISDDAVLADYIDQNVQDTYYQDFSSGELQTDELEPDSKYVLCTLGYDIYGTPCTVRRYPFATPRMPLVGSPEVVSTIAEVNKYDFTLSFHKNADCAAFAAVAGEKGTMQQQYEQWGPMMGFKNFGDLVKSWGFQSNNAVDTTFTWTGMTPGTDYEVFVQGWDVNGTYMDVDTINISTTKLGGEGLALVDVELGSYVMGEWPNEDNTGTVELPSQFISFVPNDQTAAYRMGVYLAPTYDADPEGINSYTASEPPFPGMTGWFQYEALETDYQIDPNTEFVVVTAAKNANNEWGTIKADRFTTASEVSAAAPYVSLKKQDKIAARKISSKTIYIQPGTMPSFKSKGSVLIAR